MTSSGTTAPGFEPVAEAFEANLHSRGEQGAAVCVMIAGRTVVDLWAGDARPGQPWDGDTLAGAFSTTKGATAFTIAALAEAGALDIERPIADYWPGFAASGKAEITSRQVLTHTSGTIDFPGYERIVDDATWWLDLDRIAADLETSEPAWTPGTGHGYHGVTFGLILGEVVRRATGETLGTAFTRLIAEPLRADIWIGLPAALNDRVALLLDAPVPTDPLIAAYLSMFTPDTITGRAHFSRSKGITEAAGLFNRCELWSAEFPSGGGIGSARGWAKMYDALARGGGGIISEATLAAHTLEQVRGQDLTLLFETSFGLGFMRPTPFVSLGPVGEAFGHGGLGGSVAFADPVNEVAFAYVPNQLRFPPIGETTRAGALVGAIYESLKS